jgi:hypothetical protein
MIEIQEIAETTEEIIETRVALAEEAAEKRTVESILHDLAQFIGDNPADDAGLRAAIQIIKSNY